MSLTLTLPIEQAIALRDAVLRTISNLEVGLSAEKKKVDELEFFAGSKEFDKSAMLAQAALSRENVRRIEEVLLGERAKLGMLEEQIASANALLRAHGTHPCLAGRVPHDYEVLARHPSGQFKHRKCRTCGTTEKVGY